MTCNINSLRTHVEAISEVRRHIAALPDPALEPAAPMRVITACWG